MEQDPRELTIPEIAWLRNLLDTETVTRGKNAAIMLIVCSEKLATMQQRLSQPQSAEPPGPSIHAVPGLTETS